MWGISLSQKWEAFICFTYTVCFENNIRSKTGSIIHRRTAVDDAAKAGAYQS
jgi:hypothetical protein